LKKTTLGNEVGAVEGIGGELTIQSNGCRLTFFCLVIQFNEDSTFEYTIKIEANAEKILKLVG